MKRKSFLTTKMAKFFICLLVFSITCVLPLHVYGETFTVATATEIPGMTMSQEGIDMLKKFEGFAKYPYWDYSQYTVGYGTYCPSEDLERYKADGITEEEAEALLKEYMVKMEETINAFVERQGLTLTQQQFDAIASFTYNCGASWMYNSSGFKTAVLEGKTGYDFVFEITKWSTAGGSVLPGLVTRRLCEAQLYLDGVYSNTRPSDYSYVTLNANGGSIGYKVHAFPKGVDTELKAAATLKDHEFIGWFTAAEGGTQVTVLNDSLKAGTVLHAQFKSLLPEEAIPEDTTPTEPEDTTTPTEPEETTPTTPPTEPTKPPVEDEQQKPEETPTEETVIDTVTVTGDYVNVRVGAGITNPICGGATQGTIIDLYEVKDLSGIMWGRFKTGWICLTYTTYGQTTDNGDESTPTNPPENSETTHATGVVYNCNRLNIRAGAGTHTKIVGDLKAGTRVTITEKKDVNGTAWGKIEKGWICLDYVTFSQVEETPAETVLYTGVVKDCGGLNVRKGPGTNNERCDILTNGAKINIYETKMVGSTKWGRCDYGWVSLDYVNLTEVAGEPDDTTTPEDTTPTEPENTTPPEETKPTEPETEPTTPPTEETTPPTEETTPPETKPTQPEETTPPENDEEEIPGTNDSYIEVVVTNCSALNVRESYGTSSKRVDLVLSGDKLKIYEQVYKDDMVWGRTDKGWISMKYVDFVIPTGGLKGDIQVNTLRCRNGAGLHCATVASYNTKHTVTITEIKRVDEMNWGKTNLGWISLDYVIISDK